MSSANEKQNYIVYDEIGRQLGIWADLQPPFYQGVPRPDCDITRDDAFCSPCSADQQAANNINLVYSAIYMAQSVAGRAAIKTISDNHIRIGYDQNFHREGRPQARYKDGKPFILLPPDLEPSVQHLGLIQQAAQFETVLQLGKYNVPVVRMVKAISVCGVVAMMDHGEECLENRKQEGDRFVPPRLEQLMPLLLATPLIADLQIPPEKTARSAYKQRVIAEAIDPKTTLRMVLGRKPGDEEELTPGFA